MDENYFYLNQESGDDVNALLDAIVFQLSEGTPMPTATGTLAVTMDGGIKKITLTGNCTLNASEGVTGYECAFVITTSGTTSRTLTFGTKFKSQGTLATGTVSGKVFQVKFKYDGTNWNEMSRTTAM